MSDIHAAPVASGAAPTTEDAFLADRQLFWGSFTGMITAGVIFVVLLLVLLDIFLV